jgi:NADH-ubiquinone oxidoreductase chain 5
LGTFAAFFTAFYSIRLLFLVFLSEPNGHKNIIFNAHEGSWRMTFPLFILSLLSISVGFLTKDLFIGFGSDFWGSSIFVLPQNYVLSDIEFVNLFNKLLPLIITLTGSIVAYFLYSFGLGFFYSIKTTRSFKVIYNFLNRKWYFDRVYNEFIASNALSLSYVLAYKDIDRGLIEKLGPSGMVSGIRLVFTRLNSLQSGQIYHYLFIFFMSTIFIIFIMFYVSNFIIQLSSILFLFVAFILI